MKLDQSWLKDVKVGDKVSRMISGSIVMELTVTGITEKAIVCGAWTFDRKTGAEIDEVLGWGNFGTGSFLVKQK